MIRKKPKTRGQLPAVQSGWKHPVLSMGKFIGKALVFLWGISALFYLPIYLYREFTDTIPHTWNLVMQDPAYFGPPMVIAIICVLGIGMGLVYAIWRGKQYQRSKRTHA